MHDDISGRQQGRRGIDIQRGELYVDGSTVPMGRRALAVLEMLIEASGAIVSKSDLISRAWPNAPVGDTALQVQISAIRAALNFNRTLLRTVSGRGYRLLGEWAVWKSTTAAAPKPLPTPSSNSGQRQSIYRSEECEIDLSLRQVRIHANAVPISGRAFDILAVMVQQANQIVTRGNLLDLVWPGVVVGETAIDVHISAIRKALGSHRAMLQTVSGRGFRLAGAWSKQTTNPAPLSSSLSRGNNLTNLPAPKNDIVGRAGSFEFLREACSAYRIVTLTGSGGIGKTTLAIELARGLLSRFDAGVWLVELAALVDPSLMPIVAGDAIGLQAERRPTSAEGLARLIGDDSLLLILDNCEHLIGSAAKFAETLVNLAPNVVILATSRETLKISGEYVYRVQPLDVPRHEADSPGEILSNSAVQMFLGLAEALQVADWREGRNLHSIANICRQLDGLPLAIEFAAARSASLGLVRVADGLEDRFALLTTGRRTALPRHRTLRAVFDWSYALLPDVDRLLLHRLAVFSGGFTFEAICAVMPDYSSSQIADSITSLVEKSIITLDRTTSAERWRLLETVRAYAMDKLAIGGELPTVARGHAQYFKEFFAAYKSGSKSDEKIGEDLSLNYAREIDNLRAALTWAFSPGGDATIGVSLVAAAVTFWLAESLLEECKKWSCQALADLELSGSPEQEMILRSGLGQSLMFTEGMTPATYMNLTRALSLAEALGNIEHQRRALHSLWQISLRSLDLQRALQLSRRYTELARSDINGAPVRMANLMAGISLVYQAEYLNASHLLERAAEEYLEVGYRQASESFGINARAAALGHLSPCLFARGQIDASIRVAERSIEETSEHRQPVALCLALARPAGLLLPEIGALDQAERYIALMQEQVDRHALPTFRAVAHCARGRVLAMRGKPTVGVIELKSGLEQFQETGYQSFIPPFRGYFAEALAATGDVEAGIIEAEAALQTAEQTGYMEYVPELQCILGGLIALHRPNDPFAEEFFLRAIDLSRQELALYWELRAAVGLAELWQKQDRHREARALLDPIYRRFTEGRTTSTLVRAHSILCSIGGQRKMKANVPAW